MNVLSLEERVRVVAALVEGNSIRATERLTGFTKQTVQRLGVTAGEACDRFHRAHVHGLHSHLIELDEIWAFVGKKQGHLAANDDPELVGDQYTFVALDAVTKVAISYLTGKRTAANTQTFASDLRVRVVGSPQINTDGFNAYPEALERAFGTRHHHGIAIKHFEHEGTGQDQHRYSPGKVTKVSRFRGAGSPDEDSINTTYVERQNLTMRMQMRRLTRLTNAFSKRVENLRAAVALHFATYNWVRPHMTLRVTPAMAAGLTDHVWSLHELLETALAIPTGGPPLAPPVSVVPSRIVGGLRVLEGGRR